ncbi:unnamed protein product, partial [Iphiclides podalirius]
MVGYVPTTECQPVPTNPRETAIRGFVGTQINLEQPSEHQTFDGVRNPVGRRGDGNATIDGDTALGTNGFRLNGRGVWPVISASARCGRLATIYNARCQKTDVTLAPPRVRRYVHLGSGGAREDQNTPCRQPNMTQFADAITSSDPRSMVIS